LPDAADATACRKKRFVLFELRIDGTATPAFASAVDGKA
jgi:hypothetical protein